MTGLKAKNGGGGWFRTVSAGAGYSIVTFRWGLPLRKPKTDISLCHSASTAEELSRARKYLALVSSAKRKSSRKLHNGDSSIHRTCDCDCRKHQDYHRVSDVQEPLRPIL